ncbi:MAG: cytochrome c [Candidatus Omnitrophica bacterium]|nr:cytochrome c [Candidatus Omnitrophota bacterium]
MRKYLGFFLFILIFSGSGFAAIDRDEGMAPADGFFLPEGDGVRGKKAFMDLKCTSCHWVQNELNLSAPVAEKSGPILGTKQAAYAPGWIANSITSPSHTIGFDTDGQADESDLSRMGDFTETMTVRQMIDLVAYIKSLGEEKK